MSIKLSDVKKYEMFYQEVVKAILRCGSETWVLTVPMMKLLEGAHIGFYRGMAQINTRRESEVGWIYLKSKDVLRDIGI